MIIFGVIPRHENSASSVKLFVRVTLSHVVNSKMSTVHK